MPHILVVDDCPDQQRLIAHLFAQQTGWTNEFARNGQDALLAMAEHPVDAVVCDLRMPRMDGREFLQSAIKAFPLIPVIITTAIGSEDAAIDALLHGAADYIPKRNLSQELISRLQRSLTATRQQKSEAAVLRKAQRREVCYRLNNDRALIPAMITALQEQLDIFCLCDETERIRVGVALEEALVNAIVHGNLEVSSELRGVDDEAFAELVNSRMNSSPYRDRHVTVRVTADHEQAEFSIRDEGPGFDPSSLPDPTAPENLAKASGRGLLLIRSFMTEVHHNETGNEIVLIKRSKGIDARHCAVTVSELVRKQHQLPAAL